MFDLFHLTQCPPEPFILLQMIAYQFLWMNNILCVYITNSVYPFIHEWESKFIPYLRYLKYFYNKHAFLAWNPELNPVSLSCSPSLSLSLSHIHKNPVKEMKYTCTITWLQRAKKDINWKNTMFKLTKRRSIILIIFQGNGNYLMIWKMNMKFGSEILTLAFILRD